ncbi:helix-turn-helix transcriptional regulator [Spiractinospora alimapuensis]|nr:helix-turn-helix transcriptional regulator [Spiractinospora alimapuensis]
MPRTLFGRVLVRNGYRDGTSVGLGDPRGAPRGVLHLSFATDPHKQTVRHIIRVVGQLLESLVPWDALFWDGERAGQLTARETEVLAAVMSGRSNREIAAHLGIAVRTVATHLESVYRKLGTSSRTRAAVVGAYMGLVPTPGQVS